MTGAPLSRWTMAFFAFSLMCLIGAQMLLAAGYGFPVDDIAAPETLVVVHLTSIGWLSVLMCGALFQFMPVLVDRPLSRPALVLPALFLLASGLAFLVSGFIQLSGAIESDWPLLAIGGCFLILGFALAVWVLVETLWSARPLPLPARFVAVGLTCLLLLGVLGSVFAHLLSGLIESDQIAENLNQYVALHAALGIGGWLSFCAIGVSYRLLPMFMLAPDSDGVTSSYVWLTGTSALVVSSVGVPLEILLVGSATVSAIIAACFLYIMLALYAVDLLSIYRNRRRREVELNIKAAGGAFAALYLSAILGAVLAATGQLQAELGALVYLVAFGWLGGLGLSQLYKIVPFITWMECYGPLMGRKPTPRVQDLVCERRDGPWFVLYFLGVGSGAISLLFHRPDLFRLCALATLLATVAIVVELVLARRLSNVSAARRLPEGAHLPRLFVVAGKK
ncbi:hypothetical protein [Mesorhizobium denitrificans]|uniref:Cbb3-type cytochrome c oxidase subunit I n=1 Tax=Mesorhizobium denitrificans TaxID=2294114 RepID=A0A371XKE3_9HYPH|nr:hypothetical protein [Mesorhizobium denitrificans]RFC69659.1 hypothetical protein DY251_01220 [Mesorhizobium denitrificans]